MRRWYKFRSRDGRVKGYCPAQDEEEVAEFAGYPREELVIERVKWNNKEFVKCRKTK